MRRAPCAVVAALVTIGLIVACANVVGVDRYYEECRKDASVEPPACFACLAASCHLQLSDCLCDPQCLKYLDCWNACDSGSACACAARFPAEKTSQLSQCASTCPACGSPDAGE